MKSIASAIIAFSIVLLISGCYQEYQKLVRADVETSTKEISVLEGFTLVNTVIHDYSITSKSSSCFYGRSYMIIGSDFTDHQAIQIYSDYLQRSQWKQEFPHPENEAIFIKGENERIVINADYPEAEIKDSVDINHLMNAFHSIIYIRLDYMLPKRINC